MEFSKTYKVGNREIKVSTGKLATLAQGSVLLQMGGTTLLAVTTIDKKDTEQDFFPLSIEYIEKMYARGAMSGSKFKKREGLPSDEAIIKARQVDHSVRSLFPKSFKKPTSVVLTVLSYDQINDPEALAVLGASLSLMMTGMPYYGPSSSVIACVDKENNIVVNPDMEGREEYSAEFLVSGIDDKALNIEGWAKETPEDLMDKLLDESMIVIKELNAMQRDFVKNAGVSAKVGDVKSDEEYSDVPAPQELIDMAKHDKYEEIKKSLFVEKDKDTDRQANLQKIKDEIYATEKAKEGNTYSEMDVNLAVEYVAKKIVREAILKDGKRVTNRGLDEIRPLSGEVDLLPTVHGSALFQRGLTQSLSIVTLGSASSELMVEDMEGDSTKSFMHHYNMPPFTTGEAGRYNYHPGRREIGHGAIGENALRNMIPSQEDFPYTIRVVSEIMTSNGSTSMAATCASSMALMAAGVPVKEAVGGISVGMVTNDENEDDYRLLMDIEGIEDFYGDMDFKVTGTKNGVTAIQYENKLRGVKLAILKEAFRLAKKGREQVLEAMNKVIIEARKELAPTAPIVHSVMIKQDRIGELIGPGGKNIKELVAKGEEYGKAPLDINIDDSGKIMITAANKAQLDYILGLIDNMFAEPEVGKVYAGTIDKIMPYGMFVDVSSSISGLLHVSEISDKRIEGDLSKVFEQGDAIMVKVSKMEDGRTNFTTKGVEQTPEMQEKIDKAATLPPMPRENSFGGGDRGGDRRPGGFGGRQMGDRRSRFDRR